ncbi:MAG TPA: 2,5-diamino-6-(ribosylamino)-4(3H)-pyrimidinone 5'-phosphate reductase [Methanoregulaceae archaeon]|nr:2,5-diamino-6-(ribosylamino)-4(3H)-pyrimidinone 5'-phosphate reductase [Methanoregulaceae archaeon]HPD74936.1 2,5-diamino-6-(ribosylamino)-4(3H)-pyrimidinone 5'-phosphate reductase [Methanoregulaceae archaeon]HRY75785.1 2,5-diamino-6-(ribosylamino)-4(3H)-pyrimidinone 5'-phosphate reductase [Methanoregulaceae archaeon]
MRPHVIVNLAMSADGKISTRERRQVKISGPEDFTRVDRLKAEADAIMVGIGTVLADDPSLTVKSEENRKKRIAFGKPEHPVRIVVDSRARIPLSAAVLHKGEGQRIVAVCHSAPQEKVAALREMATVIVTGDDAVDLAELLDRLDTLGIHRLMVEGGGTLIGGLFTAGLVDEFMTFVGNCIIAGAGAPTPADGEGFTVADGLPRLTLVRATRIGDGILLHWKTGP